MTGEQYAIKVMRKRTCPYANLECELLQSVSHENVLKFVEMLESELSVYLVTELLRGPELFDVLVNRDEPFCEADVLILVEQMLMAIESCHKQDFAHIDVKIENMVFRESDLQSPLVLVDFGAAQRFVRAPFADRSTHYIEGLDDEVNMLTAARPAGTIPYNSPEFLNGLFSSRSDVWSVGICMFVLLTGRRPFESQKSDSVEAEKSVVRQIRWQGGAKQRAPLNLKAPEGCCTPETGEFLEKLTRGHPSERVSTTEALNDIRKLPMLRHDRKMTAQFVY